MRVRLVRKEDGKFVPMVEVGVRKGAKVTSGKAVTREGLRAEVARLVDEVRSQKP